MWCEEGKASQGVQVLEQIEAMFDGSGHRPGWHLIPCCWALPILPTETRRERRASGSSYRAWILRNLYSLGPACRMLGEIALARGETEEAAMNRPGG